MSIRTVARSLPLAALVITFIGGTGCGTDPTVETVQRPDGCYHETFTCNPRDPNADESCSIRCNGAPMHCQEYAWDMIEWCDRYPGTYYRGNVNRKCSYSMRGGDPLWSMPCRTGWQPVAATELETKITELRAIREQRPEPQL